MDALPMEQLLAFASRSSFFNSLVTLEQAASKSHCNYNSIASLEQATSKSQCIHLSEQMHEDEFILSRSREFCSAAYLELRDYRRISAIGSRPNLSLIGREGECEIHADILPNLQCTQCEPDYNDLRSRSDRLIRPVHSCFGFIAGSKFATSSCH